MPLRPLFSCPLLLLLVRLFTGLSHICVSSDVIVGGSRGDVVQYPTDRYSEEYAIMAHNSIWQLKKLVVRYCDWGGSCRGIREFIQSHLPSLQMNNPQVEVVTEMMRGEHLHLRGYYRCSTVRMVNSRNVDAEDILLQAMRLRNALGLKVTKLKNRHLMKAWEQIYDKWSELRLNVKPGLINRSTMAMYKWTRMQKVQV